VKCPLQFYFKYVLHLSEKESLSDELETNEIGTFIHNLLKHTFIPYINKKPVIDIKFKKQFYTLLEKSFNETFLKRMKSDYYLLKEVLYFWMEHFIEFEQKRITEVEKILYLEQPFHYEQFLGQKKYVFNVIIDRVDLLTDDSILILDYKTGSKPDSTLKNFLKYKNEPLSRIFIKEKIKSFQLPIYLKTVSKNFKGKKINASLYCIKEKYNKLDLYLSEEVSQEENTLFLDTIDNALNFILTEICEIKTPFVADKNNETICKYCSFTALCK
ncbi:MAG: PD-(D/E)XK nuclease family protein, partial [Endomicrobiia bacterium]